MHEGARLNRHGRSGRRTGMEIVISGGQDMTERGTRKDFALWVEPSLTFMARYAARQVGPGDRDDVVAEALGGAWQRWSTYDESRGTAVAWLLGILAERCRRHRTPRPPTAVVELVDTAVVVTTTRDTDLERAIEGLSREQRQAVDLHYFVGLDLATVGEVMDDAPGTVTTILDEAMARLHDLLGEDDDWDRRLSADARSWQDRQPVPPEVPLDRLDTPVRRSVAWRRPVAAAVAAVLVGGGFAAFVRARGGDDTAPRSAGATPTPQVVHTRKVVPWRDLEPGHALFVHEVNGLRVTPYDQVAATGSISGTLHPGDTLVFDAVLTSPGLVTLHPCPDYTIAFGTHTTSGRLNCSAVPYLASLVRSNGEVTGFRPVLPAGTDVFFQMRVTVPDEVGRQEVRWSLDGPVRVPGFDGVVEVTPP
jgi:RNA polymerase sigma-70 factor (ECF subfamily)